jgi:D-cysteine desulfhydrase family pyridoxal phosphate-dependent enzyme
LFIFAKPLVAPNRPPLLFPRNGVDCNESRHVVASVLHTSWKPTLQTGYTVMVDSIPRVSLASLPTPLVEAPRLAREIGLATLFLKRDDLTGFAGGGTKVRKLEYDFAEILANKYDVVLTAGGVQSNHARLTAAAARRFGLDVKLVLGGPPFASFDGNLLLDILFGASIRFLTNDDDNDHLTSAMITWADELAMNGAKPYISPIGGSTGLGALGCVAEMREIAGQIMPRERLQIVLPVGSCGSFAGILLGAKLFLPNARVIGISVSRSSAAIKKRTLEVITECCGLLSIPSPIDDIAIESYDQYVLEYGIPTEEGQSAIVRCAHLEGILLDPIYTGKAMAGLIDLVGRKVLDANVPTVFIHTGGLPVLFSFEPEFRKLADCKEY